MKLTLFTDYSMRVLIYLGARPERLCSIAEIARAYRISQNHLMKVVNQLARQGYVQSVRGRSGGIRLGRPPQDINLGALIRDTEDGLQLVDCGNCVVSRACGITGVLSEALAAFMGVLGRYTLADMLTRRQDLRDMLLMDLVPVPEAASEVQARAVSARTQPSPRISAGMDSVTRPVVSLEKGTTNQ